MESLEMDRIFKSSLKKGYLTDAEFENIMQIENFDDRKSAVFDIMMVKDETIAVKIFHIFRRMTARVRAKEDNGNHPLLSAVVADCIFEFLPIEDVLNCRLVCQQWRTASSNILRKRVTIKFQKQGPYKFFQDFENCLPDINFQYFKFLDNNDGWNITDIEMFFEKCGTNIKKLKFSPRRLFADIKDLFLNSYDITPFISKACNLTKLKVVGCGVHQSGYHDQRYTLLEFQLSQLSPVKFISVFGCLISIHDTSNDNMKIKPMKLTLYDVAFKRGDTIQEKILLNDVIDFSQATKLNLYTGGLDTDIEFEFDMIGQVLNTQSLHLTDVQLKNWNAAVGKVYYFNLHGSDFEKKNRLHIEQLHCQYSKVNFSALPVTISKLRFSDDMTFVSKENINLPHLKYLRVDCNDDFEMIAYFAKCSKLVELELGQCYPDQQNVTINVNWIPKSVKRMKLHFNNIQIFTNRNEQGEGENAGQEIEDFILNLDTLILEDSLHCLSSDVSEIMSIVKPKVLVLSCCDNDRVVDTTSICEFVYANRQLEKVIVGSKDDLHKKIPFEFSVFSRFVGNMKANYYQFENHHEKPTKIEDPIGTPLSCEEFCSYTKMDELDARFYV